jgi:hypothetical protein
MVNLIDSPIASLDGYVEDEQGKFDWAAPDAEVHAFVNELERPIGTYLHGRRMYGNRDWGGDVMPARRPACVANQQPDDLRGEQRGSVSLAPLGLRIIEAMQPSASHGETAERVANGSPDNSSCGKVLVVGHGRLPSLHANRPRRREFIDLDSGVVFADSQAAQ